MRARLLLLREGRRIATERTSCDMALIIAHSPLGIYLPNSLHHSRPGTELYADRGTASVPGAWSLRCPSGTTAIFHCLSRPRYQTSVFQILVLGALFECGFNSHNIESNYVA